jgi:myosin heavy subunit
MFRILSGILTIGNLEFSTDDEGFTRQSFDEEKIKNNLSIIAVCKIRIIKIFENKKQKINSRICLVLILI